MILSTYLIFSDQTAFNTTTVQPSLHKQKVVKMFSVTTDHPSAYKAGFEIV